MKTFAYIFKSLRLEHNMTQEFVAQSLDVSKSTIGMWEIGKRMPSYEVLESIADFFNVDMAYLLGKQDTKKIVDLSSAVANLNLPLLSNDVIEKLSSLCNSNENQNESGKPNTITEILAEISKLDERKQVLVLAYLKAINGEV